MGLEVGMSFKLGESLTTYVLGRSVSTAHDFYTEAMVGVPVAAREKEEAENKTGVWKTTETVVKKVAANQNAATKPKPTSAEVRKMVNDTFARKKAEKMSLPAPFSQADLGVVEPKEAEKKKEPEKPK